MRARPRTLLLGLVLAAPVATAVVPAGADGQATAADIDSIAAALDRRIPALLDAAEVPGLSVALVADGRVAWTGANGVRSAESGAPVTRETVFQAASLSKPVFGYAVLRLAERGVIDLDRPLHEYRPNPRMAHDPRYRRITARMVLSHATGLPNWGGDRLELAFDPGTGFRYSGEGYVYLQEVVESLTGLPLHELARREVLGPLGMDRSGYVWMPRHEDDHAVGHDDVGHPVPANRYETPNAAYSLLTTAGDYGRFVAAILEGRGLEPGSRRALATPVLTAAKPSVADSLNRRIGWALGWGVVQDDPPSLWHWGDNGPFKAFVAVYPDRDLGVVYFANSTHGLAIADAVVRAATGGGHPGPAWAGYEAYDDPVRVARRAVFHAFADSGVDRGAARLTEVRVRRPDLFDPGFAGDVAALLSADRNTDGAIRVLETARTAFPDSARVLEALARTRLEAGDFDAAAATLRTLAGRADTSRAGRYRAQLQWAERRARAAADPVRVPIKRLRQLAGDYGPRHVTLEDGTLYYRRDGNSRYRLVPLGDDTFQPVGMELFRIRFEGDGPVPDRIVGLYFDGREDRTPRDPEPRAPEPATAGGD